MDWSPALVWQGRYPQAEYSGCSIYVCNGTSWCWEKLHNRYVEKKSRAVSQESGSWWNHRLSCLARNNGVLPGWVQQLQQDTRAPCDFQVCYWAHFSHLLCTSMDTRVPQSWAPSSMMTSCSRLSWPRTTACQTGVMTWGRCSLKQALKGRVLCFCSVTAKSRMRPCWKTLTCCLTWAMCLTSLLQMNVLISSRKHSISHGLKAERSM